MSEEAREIFLENFEEDRANSFMGFCVMGGIFSEGIDLTGEQLIGAVIVGTGLPQVCREREILKQHFPACTAYNFPTLLEILLDIRHQEIYRREEARLLCLPAF